jgi:hypothetical protein
MVPALISCIGATAEVFEQSQRFALGEQGDLMSAGLIAHLQMLGTYAVVFNVLSLMLFEYIVED